MTDDTPDWDAATENLYEEHLALIASLRRPDEGAMDRTSLHVEARQTARECHGDAVGTPTGSVSEHVKGTEH